VLMSLLTSELETGYFATAFRVLEFTLMIPSLLISMAFPIFSRAARDDPERLARAVERTYTASLTIGLGISLAIVAGADLLIELIAGAEGAQSVEVLRVLGLSIPLTFIAVAAGYSLLALREGRSLILATALALATGVTMSVLLIPPFGATGGAVATVIGEVVLAAGNGLLLARARRELGLPLCAWLRPVAAAACSAGLVLVIGLSGPAALIGVVASYAGLLLLSGGVPGVSPRRAAANQ
jgi:O-antigen/teichoic acid export membrane protein